MTSTSRIRSSARELSISSSSTGGCRASTAAGRSIRSGASTTVDPIRRFYDRLASFSRLILFDKRGTGLSDRVPPDDLPSLETRMDDMRAVLDAVGVERSAVVGHSEGGAMSALFAATYPERTQALVMCGSAARTRWAPDYPIGATDKAIEELVNSLL